MRLVHPLTPTTLEPELVGRLGTCLGDLLSLGLPVAPGFAISTGAWHLDRVYGPASELPPLVAAQIGEAVAVLGARATVWVRAAPVSGRGTERCVDPSVLERAVHELFAAASAPTAVVVQAQGPVSGRGTAVTRDPRRGTVWPSGEFRSAGRAVDLDVLSRGRPALGVQLRSGLGRIESLYKDVCEVSFSVAGTGLLFDDVRRLRHSREAAQQLVDVGLRRRRADALGSSGSAARPEP